MASGWNLWVWLQCIGVASQRCYKEVYIYPHNNYFSTPLVLGLFLAAASLLLCSFLNVFSVFTNKNKKPKWRFLTSHSAHVNCAIMAMLYTHTIGNQP